MLALNGSRWTASVWWAAGMACCVAPLAASIWTPNRSAAFYPVVGVAVAVGVAAGAVVGPARASRQKIGPALVVATMYPVSLALALGIEGVERDRAWGTAALVVLGGAAIGAIAPALRPLTERPATALRRGSVAWAIVSVLTVPLLGLGLLGIPLVVSYRLAASAIAGSR